MGEALIVADSIYPLITWGDLYLTSDKHEKLLLYTVCHRVNSCLDALPRMC